MVAASIISIAANPYVYGGARRLVAAKKGKVGQREAGPRSEIQPKRCILVGFGPVGRTVHQLLLDTGGEIVVIDLNLENVRELRNAGHRAVYGDVKQPGTLTEAGIEATETLVLSADIEDAADIIKQALQLNPELRVLVRCAYLREAAALRDAGADFVAAGEAEVGVALTEAVISLRDVKGDDAHRAAIRHQLYNSAIPHS